MLESEDLFVQTKNILQPRSIPYRSNPHVRTLWSTYIIDHAYGATNSNGPNYRNHPTHVSKFPSPKQ